MPARLIEGRHGSRVEPIVEHPDVVDVKWQLLATRDANGRYGRFGHGPLAEPRTWMQRRGRD